MKVTAAIINYNGAPFLNNCLNSLLAQTRLPEEIVVVDNDSTDDSLTILNNYASKIRLIKTGRNLGFAGGANRAIRSSRFPYLLLMNPDVVVTPDFIENLLKFAENHPAAGSLTGKLLRFSAPESPVIDSTGHQLLRSRWVINRGEEDIDHGQYELPEEVFGVCGAAAFYRRAMLEDIQVNEEFLDEDFFLYLEDVDLDWRARLKGWKAYYVPNAVGYHQRGYLNIFKSKNTAVLRHCLKNRYLMMIKNDHFGDIFIDAWAILPLEVIRLVKFLITSPRSLVGYWDVLRLLPRVMEKRRRIQKDIRISRPERRRWFHGSHSLGPIGNRLRLLLYQPFLKKSG